MLNNKKRANIDVVTFKLANNNKEKLKIAEWTLLL